MKKQSLKTVALTGALSLLASASFAVTLDEAVNKTLNSHPEVKAAERNVMAVEQEHRQARGGFLPSVDLTATSGWEHSNNNTTRNRATRADGEGHRDMWRNESRLTVSQMLFDGFQTKAQVCQQAARHRSAAESLNEIKETTSLRAIEAYMDVLRNRELTNIASENLSKHKNYLKQVKSRADSGRGSQADVRQAEGRVALAEAGYYAAKGELKQATADYVEITGEKPTKLRAAKVPFKALPKKKVEAMALAIENHPAIKSATHDITAANEAYRETKSAFMPRFDAEVAASRNHDLDGVDGDNNEGTALVRMSYNLYRGGADKARKRERLERLAEAQQTLERDRRLVEENMDKAWSNLETSRARLQPLSQHVLSADQTRTAYKSQFDIGQRSLLDLLDSEIESYNARVAMINGRYAVDFSVYEVLANAGVLVKTVNGE